MGEAGGKHAPVVIPVFPPKVSAPLPAAARRLEPAKPRRRRWRKLAGVAMLAAAASAVAAVVRNRGKPEVTTAGHAELCRIHLDAYDLLTGQIAVLDQLVERAAEPFDAIIARLVTIPGIGPRIAQVIVAETGGDMARFASSARLAAWAGLVPGDNESAGKRKKAAARKGNPHLRSAMVGGGHGRSRAPPAAPAPGSGDWPTGSAGSTSRRPPLLSPIPCCESPGQS